MISINGVSKKPGEWVQEAVALRKRADNKQIARNNTNQHITDIQKAQELVYRKKPESIFNKAEDISVNRESYYNHYAKDSHPDLHGRYQLAKSENNVSELRKLDTELAERLILDNPNTQRISYGNNESRARESLQELQKLSKYKNNLELTQQNGERMISYVKDIGRLDGLKRMLVAQEGQLNKFNQEAGSIGR